MRIGIIGAGNIGGTLTRRLVPLGHEVRVANSRGPETLADLARESGATAVLAADAAQDADLVIVTIPEKDVPGLATGILDAAAPGAVIIDTGNYYPKQRDGRIEAIEQGTPESVWVAGILGRPVVKVFNGIYAAHLLEKGTPGGTPGRVALPVAGDDDDAKQLVMDLVDALGFDPVDAGPLAESWRQQPDQPVYLKDADAETTRRLLAEASPERPADFTA